MIQRQSGGLRYHEDIAGRLRTALSQATDGQVILRSIGSGFGEGSALDVLLTVQLQDDSFDIAVAVLRNAYPRDVRHAIWQLEEHELDSGQNERLVKMVAAESLSPGAKEILRKRGIGYFEANGNLDLRWRQLLIHIERPRRAGTTKEGVALFTDAREMVVHALLKHRNEWLTGGELAEMASTSSYTCSVVLQELERREWCETMGAGPTRRRRLSQPGQLLDAWAEHWTLRKQTRSRWYLFPARSGLLTQLTYKIAQSTILFPWAFTGTAAANIFAPLLTSVDTADIIVPHGQAEQLASLLDLKPADKGANITLVEREGASLQFLDRHPEFESYFASPFILYLDLLDGRGRNKELAQHVRERLEL